MNKINYICTSCNWKFSSTYPPKMCPYCSKKSVIVDNSGGAQDIINEIEDMEQQFKQRS